MVDRTGAAPTGLLSGLRYIKDNRLLPRGFDKSRAGADVAVHGGAVEDLNFAGGDDRVRYRVAAVDDGALPVDAELLYQTVGFRWADNLRRHRTAEIDRFVRDDDALAQVNGARLASVTAITPRE